MSQSKDRQKQLTREYKKRPRKIGAYCIRNTDNQKCFVGISRDIDARLNRHRFALKSNTEELSPSLQEDWNQFGAERFEFVILETLEPPKELERPYDPSDDLLVLEQLMLEQLQPFVPNGYNQPPKG